MKKLLSYAFILTIALFFGAGCFGGDTKSTDSNDTTTSGPELNVKINSANYASGGSYPFSQVLVGSSTVPLTFTVENTGTASLTLTSPNLTGDTADFTLTTSGFSTTISPGSNTTFTVAFNPLSAGSKNGWLTFTSSDSDEASYSVHFTGSGTVSEMNLIYGSSNSLASGANYSFGGVQTSASTTLTFNIQNLNAGPLTISGITITGTSTSDFVLNTTGTMTTVPGSTQTSFTLTFTPGSPGLKSALLTVTNSDSDEGTYTVNLSGTGTYYVSTYAGIMTSPGITNGASSTAQFQNPVGLALDSGRFYIADTGNNKIRTLDWFGSVADLAGSGTYGCINGTSSSTAQFKNPNGVAVASSSDVFVADTYCHMIRKVTWDGNVSFYAGTGISGSNNGATSTATFSFPRGIAVDSAGNIFVADTGNHLIRKITPGGTVSTLAGSGTATSTDGTGTAASFNQPYGLAIASSSGDIYVADYFNHKIRKITSGGVVTTFAGSGSAGSLDGTGTAAQFSYPQGITIENSTGNLFVADSNNNIIRLITPSGVVTTIAGTPGISGSTNGLGTTARFGSIQGIVVDVFGNVYVTDYTNHVIRKVVP